VAGRISRRSFARALAVAGLARSGAASQGALQRFEDFQPHMGTMFRIALYAPDIPAAKEGFRAAFEEIRRLDEALSDYREDSELNRLCRASAGRPVPLSDALFEALSTGEAIAAKTGGAFDVTLGPAIRLWRKARNERRLPGEAERQNALSRCGYRKLQLDEAARTATLAESGMQLDLGGIAKGLAADRALAVLEKNGLRSALVAAGGDVRTGAAPAGEPGWKVGVRGLDKFGGGYSRVLTLAHAAVSTSGDAEQFAEIGGVRYSHIVDPRTGLGLRERLSATVLASTGVRADALATAASVLGAERGLEFLEAEPEAEGLLIDAAGDGYEQAVTRGFPQPENHCEEGYRLGIRPRGTAESLC
jgi:thiamine biosynthesis lipoprotein